MKSIRNGKVKIFSSPKEMPIGRYSDFQKYLSREISIEESLLKAKAFLQEDKIDNCEIEIDNVILRQNELKNGIGLLTYPFAILVAEIDGKQANDTSIDGLNNIILQLDLLGLTQQEIELEVFELKKK